MTPFDEIKTILDRIAATGAYTETDLTALLRALLVDGKGNVILQIGKYNVYIEQGQDIQIGDRIIYQGSDAEAIRQTIRQMLEEYRLRPGIPFQAPPLPEHFVPRPEVTDVLKARLLADSPTTPGILVVSAIQGLGGIGKSTLAAALAYDPQVQRRFKDGILWATLGQQPDLLSLLSSWIQALSNHNFHPTTVEAASTHLRTLLHDKATLLVVDDVWEPKHALPFRVGSEQSQVLITTRRGDVAEEVDAELHQIDVMTPEQSLDLLVSRLRRPLAESEREEALHLAKEVGYLPLALELAAARVARDITWTVLQRAFETEVARLEALESPRRRRSGLRLEASFNLSLNALRNDDERAWQAFVWLGALPEDARIAAPMTATLWEMDKTEADDILELLWNDALLLPASPTLIGDREWPTYRLHDLLHDIACRLLVKASPDGLGTELPEAHAALLERYKKPTQSDLWHTLSDDGYIHARLAWHMEQAGRTDELHTLLREETADGQNGWYQARDRLGQTAGYLADVTHAWRLASEEFSKHQTPISAGLQCRYALIAASINSLASKIPPAMLIALVKEGVWTPAKGLAYARQIPDLAQRARALVGLALRLPEVERVATFREALTTVQTIRDENQRANALNEVIPHLPEVLLQEALIVAQTIERPGNQVIILAKLAESLTEPLKETSLQKALEVAQKIKSFDDQAKILAWLAPRLPNGLKERALENSLAAAKNISGEYNRAETLLILALDPLPDSLKETALQQALAATQKIKSEQSRANMLAALVCYLPERLLDEALTTAWDLKNYRFNLLLELTPCLPESWLRKALAMAQETSFESHRAEAMATFLPRLAELGYRQEAQTMGRNIQPIAWRVKALAKISLYLPESERAGILQEALAIAREIQTPEARTMQALAEVGVHLPEPERTKVLEEALAIAQYIHRDEARFKILTEIAFRLPEPEHRAKFLQKAISAARWDEKRAEIPVFKAFAEVSSHLPKSVREDTFREALGVAQKIWPSEDQGKVLMELAPFLPESLHGEALKITREMVTNPLVDSSVKVEVLARLVPRLSEPLLREASLQAWRIWIQYGKDEALTVLTPHLSKPLLQELLKLVLEIQDEKNRLNLLKHLAIKLVELPYPQKAIELVRKIRLLNDQAELLAILAPRLGERGLASEVLTAMQKLGSLLFGKNEREVQVHEILTVVEELVDDYITSIKIFVELIPYLSEPEHGEMLQATLAVARKIWLERERVTLLTKLASYMSEPERDEVLREALAIAWKIENGYDQASVLSEIARHRPKSLFWGVLSAVRRMQHELDQAEALIGLIPYLPESLLRRALVMAQQIKNKKDRLNVLAVLASRLSEAERADVLQDMSSITQQIREETKLFGQETDLVFTLTKIAPYLPENKRTEVLWEALVVAQKISSRYWNVPILAILALQLTKLGYIQEALAAVQAIEEEEYQAKALIELASHLPKPLLREALATARAINDENNRAKAIMGLAPHLPQAEQAKLLKEATALLPMIRDESERAKALAGVASCQPELTGGLLYPLWRETLPGLARRSRRDLLNDLQTLTPVIAALGGSEAIEETFCAIQDVGRWWP